MNDPRLNSIHLDPERREEFRRAREALLSARGCMTIASERLNLEEETNPRTLVVDPGREGPKGLDWWLADKDFVYPLHIGLNTVGRAPENDVVLADAYVSRRHCAILVHQSSFCELHDIASKNGTWVNGRRINGGSLRLKSGDEIRLCERNLVFRTRGGPVAEVPANTLTHAV